MTMLQEQTRALFLKQPGHQLDEVAGAMAKIKLIDKNVIPRIFAGPV
jgi:hypothetical protein